MWQSMKVISIVAAGMLVAALVGCATTETQPSASVTSLAPNAQHWFRVSWTAEPDRNGSGMDILELRGRARSIGLGRDGDDDDDDDDRGHGD